MKCACCGGQMEEGSNGSHKVFTCTSMLGKCCFGQRGFLLSDFEEPAWKDHPRHQQTQKNMEAA